MPSKPLRGSVPSSLEPGGHLSMKGHHTLPSFLSATSVKCDYCIHYTIMESKLWSLFWQKQMTNDMEVGVHGGISGSKDWDFPQPNCFMCSASTDKDTLLTFKITQKVCWMLHFWKTMREKHNLLQWELVDDIKFHAGLDLDFNCEGWWHGEEWKWHLMNS